MLRILTVFFAFPLLFSCDSTFDASRLDSDLPNSTWLFDRADAADGVVSNDDSLPQRASITFGARSDNATAYDVQGYNGCNAFSGKYSLGSDNELTFSQIVQTERACAEKEARIEEVFNRAILGARSYAFEGDVLVIEAPGQSVELRLVREIAG